MELQGSTKNSETLEHFNSINIELRITNHQQLMTTKQACSQYNRVTNHYSTKILIEALWSVGGKCFFSDLCSHMHLWECWRKYAKRSITKTICNHLMCWFSSYLNWKYCIHTIFHFAGTTEALIYIANFNRH